MKPVSIARRVPVHSCACHNALISWWSVEHPGALRVRVNWCFEVDQQVTTGPLNCTASSAPRLWRHPMKEVSIMAPEVAKDYQRIFSAVESTLIGVGEQRPRKE